MIPAPWTIPNPTTFALDTDGIPTTPDAIEFRVTDRNGTQKSGGADPTWNAATEVATGYYKAVYADASGSGRRIVQWRMRLESTDPWTTWEAPWETGRVASGSPYYALISDLRDEGVTTTDASDARALVAIMRASGMISAITGRVFGAFLATYLVDGRGRGGLLLDQPVIGVSELVVGAESLTSDEDAVDPIAYRVYNRHITQGLLMPDDRQCPRIELRAATEIAELLGGVQRRFPRGSQNIRVSGVFGYTDADGSPAGGIPMLIRHAATLLAIRYVGERTNDDVATANSLWRVTEERTREQTIKYADPMSGRSGGRGGNSLLGAFTGDPEIDMILASFIRPPAIAGV